MQDKKPFSTRQLVLLIVASRVIISYTYLPIINTPPNNQDAWLVGIYSIVYTTVLSIPLLYLINKFRGICFTDMLEMLTGSFMGKVIAIIFVIYFLFCNTVCFVQAVLFLNVSIITQTPPIVIMLFIIIPCAYIVYKGAPALARVAELVVPYVLWTIVLFFVLALNKMDFKELLPILSDSSFFDVNYGAFLIASRFADFVVVAALAFELKDNVNINKSFFYILGLFTFLFILIIIPTITVLGIETARHMWNPYYVFTTSVDLYDFIQRVEVISTSSWLVCSIIKLALYLYVSARVLSQVFKTKSHNFFTIPIAVLIVAVSQFSGIYKTSIIDFLRSYKFFPWIGFAYMFVLPFILLIIYLISKNKVNLAIDTAKRNMAMTEAKNNKAMEKARKNTA